MAACRSVGGVRHPGIIPVIDIVESDGGLHVITAYAPGPALKSLLAAGEVRGWAPDAVSAVVVLGDVADAVLGLHARRLAHGALASSSVVIGYDGVARLCDSSLLAAMTGTPLDAETDRRAWADLARSVTRAWVQPDDPAAGDIARAADAAAPFDGRRGDLAGAAAQLAHRGAGMGSNRAREVLRAVAGEWASQRAVAPAGPRTAPEGTATLLDLDDGVLGGPGSPGDGGAAPSASGGAASPAPGGVSPAAVTAGKVWTIPAPPVGSPTVHDAPLGTPTVHEAPLGTPTVHDVPPGTPTVRDAPVGMPTLHDAWGPGRPPPVGTPTVIEAGAGTPTVFDGASPTGTPYRLGVPAPAMPPSMTRGPAILDPGAASGHISPGGFPGAPGAQQQPSFSGPEWFSRAAPPRRGRTGLVWLLAGALAFLAVAGAGVLVLLSRSSSGPALSVTGIVAVAQPARAGCDSDVHVSGTITTNGGKGTIDYQWFRDGQPVSADILHMPVDKDQTQVHLPDLTLTNTGRGHLTAKVTLTVISPAGSVPGTTSFAYSC